ncbi:PEP-CTERM sorting domain-containing protein [Streptomyces bungoensis]
MATTTPDVPEPGAVAGLGMLLVVAGMRRETSATALPTSHRMSGELICVK